MGFKFPNTMTSNSGNSRFEIWETSYECSDGDSIVAAIITSVQKPDDYKIITEWFCIQLGRGLSLGNRIIDAFTTDFDASWMPEVEQLFVELHAKAELLLKRELIRSQAPIVEPRSVSISGTEEKEIIWLGGKHLLGETADELLKIRNFTKCDALRDALDLFIGMPVSMRAEERLP